MKFLINLVKVSFLAVAFMATSTLWGYIIMVILIKLKHL